jgi:hypothetical protein
MRGTDGYDVHDAGWLDGTPGGLRTIGHIKTLLQRVFGDHGKGDSLLTTYRNMRRIVPPIRFRY